MYLDPLKDGFGLLEERGETNSFISLIYLNLHRHTLQKLDTLEYSSDWINIVVNQSDPTTLILTLVIDGERSFRICNIVDNAVIVKNVIAIDFYPECFYDKYVYDIKLCDEDGEFLEVRILNISS
jgi:hypothetical protein